MNPSAFACALAAALLLAACEAPQQRRAITETESVEAAGAHSARVEIEMGAGDLRVVPGTSKLLEAEFRYDDPSWKPEIKYDVSGGRGYLSVRQPPMRGLRAGAHDNRWELHVSDHLPLELRVKLGAGQSDLRLAGLDLRRLEVEVGAGELRLDLNDRWDNDLDGRIQGGVGVMTVRLPRQVGVRVNAEGGIGSINARGLEKRDGFYVNDAWGKSDVRVRLDIAGGIGQINLEM